MNPSVPCNEARNPTLADLEPTFPALRARRSLSFSVILRTSKERTGWLAGVALSPIDKKALFLIWREGWPLNTLGSTELNPRRYKRSRGLGRVEKYGYMSYICKAIQKLL